MISATRSEQGRQVDEDDIFIDLMSLLTCCLWSPAPERRERANAPGRGALPDSTPARTRPLNRNPEVPKAERKSGPPLMISATRSEQGRQGDEDDIFVDLTSLLTCCLWSPAPERRAKAPGRGALPDSTPAHARPLTGIPKSRKQNENLGLL